MGFSPLSALVIIGLHFLGANLYLIFLRVFLTAHNTICEDENCVYRDLSSVRAYTQATLWPIYTVKWVALTKGWI